MTSTFDPETGEIKRKYVDLTNMTMDGQWLPIEYVDGEIIWKSQEHGFQNIIDEIETAPKPGFFLTSQEREKKVRVRWCLNRHCILSSEPFYDSSGMLYRDVDAKGVGYTRGFPMKFLSVRLPEMRNDMEMRGILHNDVATGDCLNTEELYEAGIRMARYVAQIELFELVNQKGEVVPRKDVNEELMLNFDVVKPTIAVRAMGTTSRVYDLRVSERVNNRGYVNEIIDDAIGLVSMELGQEISPEDYVVWFTETLGKQIGGLHEYGGWTDAMAQIHGGLHNVTLDCRLTDTYHYQTPKATRREYEQLLQEAREDPKHEWFLESRFPSNFTREKAMENNLKGQQRDRDVNLSIAEHFVAGVNEIYPLGKLSDRQEVERIFDKGYMSER